MRSVMQHQFAQAPQAETQRSSFDRSFAHKTTFDADFLVPIFVDEVLPGDTFNVDMQAFARMATPIHPIMDNLFLDTFFFYVPNRLVWENWEKFCGAQDNPGDSTDYIIPTISVGEGGNASGSIWDYFGLPTEIAGGETIEVNALPFRAYCLIYNEWFRDQNLQDGYDVPKGDGPDGSADYWLDLVNNGLPRRGKRHDYFTSALPWPQKGPDVLLPLGTTAPLTITGNGTNAPVFETTQPGFESEGYLVTNSGNNDVTYSRLTGTDNSGQLSWVNPALTGFADLTQATAATINQLRESFQIQRLLEKDARGGTRYTEIIKSHFGVTSPDFRLQRPEYLGGGSTQINMDVVAQTSETTAESPQAELAGIATATVRNNGFTKSFVEHGYIIGIANVRADLTYQRGINRMWSRSTRYDFYWPTLAHLGEQEVLNKEIWADGTATDDEVFGYQERYAEYRYKPSMITGVLRSDHPQSLDVWHLSQDFETRPALNASFIESNTPMDRVIAVPSEPQFIFDSYIQMRCARPMPLFSVPGLIDHF